MQIHRYILRALELGLLVCLVVAQVGCTQRTTKFSRKTLNVDSSNSGTSLIKVAEMSYNGVVNGQQVSGLNIASLNVTGDSLYLTGTPIGAGVATLRQDPENPSPRWFAVNYQNQFSSGFTSNGFMGTIAVQGGIFSTSGDLGTIFMINDSIPKTLMMKPSQTNQFGQLVADVAWIGVVAFYNNYFYVFKNSGYVLTYQLGGTVQQPTATLVDNSAYDSEINCCVTSATVIPGSKPVVHVAFGDRLVTYDIGSNGRLNSATAWDGLRVSSVFKSRNSIYLYNKPAYTGTNSNSQPEGLYQFDITNGTATDYIPISASAMAIYNDTHIYYYDGLQSVVSIARIIHQ